MIAERSTKYGRTYIVRDRAGVIVAHLSFRDLRALDAVAAGRARWRMHRTYTPWLCDAYLEPECEDYGVGPGTLTGLRAGMHADRPLIAPHGDREGPVRLSSIGRRVHRAIAALDGVTVAA